MRHPRARQATHTRARRPGKGLVVALLGDGDAAHAACPGAVGQLTTCSISDATACAVVGVMACVTPWLDGPHGLVVGIVDLSDRWGWRMVPPLATASATSAICSGVTANVALADGGLGEERLVLVEGARRPGRGSATAPGERSRGGDVADTELGHAGRERLAEVEADLAERRVARLDEALDERAAARLAAEVLERRVRLRQRQRARGTGTPCRDVVTPSSSATPVVTILNVEPGG